MSRASMREDSRGGNKRGFYKAVGIIEAVPNNPEWNYGGRVCLPHEFLATNLHWPQLMIFEVTSAKDDRRRVKCGVIEFTAEPGQIYMPAWMLKRLDVSRRHDEVTVNLIEGESLPKASLVLFRDEDGHLLRLGAKVILEKHLRAFPILSQGQVIPVEFNGKIYPVKIEKTLPENDVITVDANVSVDFVQEEHEESDAELADFSWKASTGLLRFARKND